MATGNPTDLKLKAEILDRIRNHGVAVSTVSRATGVSTSIIYRWLRAGIVDKDRNLILLMGGCITLPLYVLHATRRQYVSCLLPTKSIPHYGVRRLADELHWDQSKTRRIRTLAGVVIARRSKKYGKRSRPEITAPQNALKQYAVFRDEARLQAGMGYRGMVNTHA